MSPSDGQGHPLLIVPQFHHLIVADADKLVSISTHRNVRNCALKRTLDLSDQAGVMYLPVGYQTVGSRGQDLHTCRMVASTAELRVGGDYVFPSQSSGNNVSFKFH